MEAETSTPTGDADDKEEYVYGRGVVCPAEHLERVERLGFPSKYPRGITKRMTVVALLNKLELDMREAGLPTGSVELFSRLACLPKDVHRAILCTPRYKQLTDKFSRTYGYVRYALPTTPLPCAVPIANYTGITGPIMSSTFPVRPAGYGMFGHHDDDDEPQVYTHTPQCT
jgi:hypothetical protein